MPGECRAARRSETALGIDPAAAAWLMLALPFALVAGGEERGPLFAAALAAVGLLLGGALGTAVRGRAGADRARGVSAAPRMAAGIAVSCALAAGASPLPSATPFLVCLFGAVGVCPMRVDGTSQVEVRSAGAGRHTVGDDRRVTTIGRRGSSLLLATTPGMLAFASAVLTGAGLLALCGLGVLLGFSGNAFFFSSLAVLVLAAGAVLSGLVELAGLLRESQPNRDETDGATRDEPTGRGAARVASCPLGSRPTVREAFIVCLPCTACLFARGLTYAPYRASLWSACLVTAGALLVVALLLYAAMRTDPRSRRPRWLGRAVYLAGCLLAIASFALLGVNAPQSYLVGGALADAAALLLGPLALGVVSGLSTPAPGNEPGCSGSRPDDAPGSASKRGSFPGGIIFTGWGWAYLLGQALTNAVGLDQRITLPVLIVLACVLAVAGLVLLMDELGREGIAGSAAEGFPRGASAAAAASAPNDAVGPMASASPGPDAASGIAASAAGPSGAAAGTAASAAAESNAASPTAPSPAPISATDAQKVIDQMHRDALAPYGLSKRETQVALLAIMGLTAAATAEELGISMATVKFHLSNTYRKIGIQSKGELIELATKGKRPDASKKGEQQS